MCRRKGGYNRQRILNMKLPERRKKEAAEKIHGRSEGGHGEASCDRGTL